MMENKSLTFFSHRTTIYSLENRFKNGKNKKREKKSFKISMSFQSIRERRSMSGARERRSQNCEREGERRSEKK